MGRNAAAHSLLGQCDLALVMSLTLTPACLGRSYQLSLHLLSTGTLLLGTLSVLSSGRGAITVLWDTSNTPRALRACCSPAHSKPLQHEALSIKHHHHALDRILLSHLCCCRQCSVAALHPAQGCSDCCHRS